MCVYIYRNLQEVNTEGRKIKIRKGKKRKKENKKRERNKKENMMPYKRSKRLVIVSAKR